MGIGKTAKMKSVRMLMMLLKRPMEEKVLAEKHRVEGRRWREWFQLADTGVQLKIKVPAQAIMKQTRKTSISKPLALSFLVLRMIPPTTSSSLRVLTNRTPKIPLPFRFRRQPHEEDRNRNLHKDHPEHDGEVMEELPVRENAPILVGKARKVSSEPIPRLPYKAGEGRRGHEHGYQHEIVISSDILKNARTYVEPEADDKEGRAEEGSGDS